MKYLFLYSSIIFNILTNVGFKFASLPQYDQQPVKKWSFFAVGLIFGLINSVLFMKALEQVPLQVASAIFFSLTIMGLSAAAYFFNDPFTFSRFLIGGGLIIAGVVVISLE